MEFIWQSSNCENILYTTYLFWKYKENLKFSTLNYQKYQKSCHQIISIGRNTRFDSTCRYTKMWYGHVCCFLLLIKRTIIMLTYNQWNPGVVSAVIDILHMFCAHYIVRFLSEALQMKTIISILFMVPRKLMHVYI